MLSVKSADADTQAEKDGDSERYTTSEHISAMSSYNAPSCTITVLTRTTSDDVMNAWMSNSRPLRAWYFSRFLDQRNYGSRTEFSRFFAISQLWFPLILNLSLFPSLFSSLFFSFQFTFSFSFLFSFYLFFFLFLFIIFYFILFPFLFLFLFIFSFSFSFLFCFCLI